MANVNIQKYGRTNLTRYRPITKQDKLPSPDKELLEIFPIFYGITESPPESLHQADSRQSVPVKNVQIRYTVQCTP